MRIKGLVVARSAVLRADLGDGVADDSATVQDDGSLGTMFVRFSPFNTWYEINSFWEGRFLERTLPGAFKKTANDAKRSDGLFSTRVMFDHGMDLNIGDKLLGVPTRFEEVNTDGYHGPELEVPLANTSYNRDLVPILRKGGYGSSFMFESIRESWNNEPEASDHNPDGLPERTIQEVRTFEAGPVTWPASPTATAGMRSLTDGYLELLQTRSTQRYDDLVRCYQAFRAAHPTRDFVPGNPTPAKPAGRQFDEGHNDREQALRSMRLRLMKAGR